MPERIPGSPEMIVQNMPGAGSVVATNFVYNVAKPDGLTIGFPSSAIYLDQLIGRAEAKFDIRKFALDRLTGPRTGDFLYQSRNKVPTNRSPISETPKNRPNAAPQGQ